MSRFATRGISYESFPIKKLMVDTSHTGGRVHYTGKGHSIMYSMEMSESNRANTFTTKPLHHPFGNFKRLFRF